MPDVVPFLSNIRNINKYGNLLPNKSTKPKEKMDSVSDGFTYSSNEFRTCQSLIDSLKHSNNKIPITPKIKSCDSLISIFLSSRGLDDVFGTQRIPTNVNDEPFGSPSHK